MSFFGVELNAQVNKLIGQIKLSLNKNKYFPNFRTIYRSFVNYDQQQIGIVTIEQLDKVLQQNGIFLKKFELQALQKAFPQESKINWYGLMSVLRQNMNPFRYEVVEEVFEAIDPDHAGQIHYSQLSNLFNVSDFLEFKLKQKSKERIQKEMFGLVPLTPQGYITKEEFISFYNDLSLNILDDKTFAKFVSQQWNHEYSTKPQLSQQQIKESIKLIRFKLIQKTGGTHEQYLLKQVFNEFDVNRNGNLNEQELHTMLVKLQIPTEKVLIKPLLRKLDKTGNGVVEYDEFKNFLFFDPYQI